MIYKDLFVLTFSYLFAVWYCSADPTGKLDYLFTSTSFVIRCSPHQYLVGTNLSKVLSSNISCPYDSDPFREQSPDIYRWEKVYGVCDESLQVFHVRSHLQNPESPHLKNKKGIKKRLPISAILYSGDSTKSIEGTWDGDEKDVSLDQGFQKWSTNHIYTIDTALRDQPIICHIVLNLTVMIEDGKCTNQLGRRTVMCYYEPGSKPPLNAVRWDRLNDLVENRSYFSSNWTEQGGYYLDLRSLTIKTSSVRDLRSSY